jgi:beta-glucosidase
MKNQRAVEVIGQGWTRQGLAQIRQVLFAVLAVAGSLGQASAQGGAAGEELIIFSGQTETPYRMLLGDQGGWDSPAGDSAASSNAGALSVEPVGLQAQDDARQITWSGRGEGQFYFAAAEPQDMRGLLKDKAALSFFLRVNQAPAHKVTLRMGCRYPCASNADITGLLKALPVDTWVRVSVDLQCFAQQGLEPDHVDVPFLLLTDGKLSLSVAEIKIASGLATSATISCQRGKRK